MIKINSLKFYLLFCLISCSFVSEAAFVSHQDSSIKTDNFILLTPIKASFSDRFSLRTKEHLMVNEGERIIYALKDSRGSKRGEIIHIMDNEVQVYNQVTGKVDYVAVDNIKSIRRVYNWKAWAGFFTGFFGAYLFMMGAFLLVFSIISLIINSGLNGGLNLSFENFLGIYGIFALLFGLGASYTANNVLYKFKKFRIGRRYKIGVFSMKQKNK